MKRKHNWTAIKNALRLHSVKMTRFKSGGMGHVVHGKTPPARLVDIRMTTEEIITTIKGCA